MFLRCYFKLILIPVKCSFKTYLKCCNSFPLSIVDKFATETLNFVSVIGDCVAPVPAEVTQSADQAKMKLISQLNQEVFSVKTAFRSSQ